jgi:hypothetical protein
VIVRPLAQDFDHGRLVGTALYHDMRQWWHDLRPANSGRWDLTVRAGEGRLSRYRTVAPSPSPAGSSSHAGRAPLALGARGLAALYAGTPVATLRRAGLAVGGSQDADAALDGAFAATPFMLDGF